MGRRKDKPHPGVHRPGRPIPGESHDDYSLPEDETSGGGGKPGKKG